LGEWTIDLTNASATYNRLLFMVKTEYKIVKKIR
jgi:hypothetical protein